MPLITVSGGCFCGTEQLARSVCRTFARQILEDTVLVAEVAKRSGMSENKLRTILHAGSSVFNRFTHFRESGIALLKLALADFMKLNSWVCSGLAGFLIPREMPCVLRVCALAAMDYRVERAMKEKGLSRRRARRRISKEDGTFGSWTSYLYQQGPWDPGLYDLMIRMDQTSTVEAALLVEERVKQVSMPSSLSLPGAIEDFAVAARVELAVAPFAKIAVLRQGSGIAVSARNGCVTLTTKKHVLLLTGLQEKLKCIAAGVPGVMDVKIEVGPGFCKPDIYRRCGF